MSSDIQLAKSIFNIAYKPANGNTQGIKLAGNTDLSSTSVRYGTVIAINEDGTYQVQLAGSEEPITVESEVPLSVGQGVTLTIQDGRYVISGLSTFIKNQTEEYDRVLQAEQDLRESVEGIGETIKEQVEKELEGVDTKYNTRFEETDRKIEAEAEARRDAINGAYAYTDSKLTIDVDSISAQVEEKVASSLGDTFATKSEVKQTADSWGIELSKVASTADNASSNASAALSTANSAYNGVSDAAKTATSYLYYDANGLVLGNGARATPTGTNARLTSSALEFRNGSTVWSTFGATSAQIGQTTASNLYLDGTNLIFRKNGSNQFRIRPNAGQTIVDAGDTNRLSLFNGDTAKAQIHLTTDGYISTQPSGRVLDYWQTAPATANNLGYLSSGMNLYYNSSGTTGTVTLKRSAAYYSYFDIIFYDGTRDYCQRVFNTGHPSTLFRMVYNNSQSTAYYSCDTISISGTSITRTVANCCQGWMTASGNGFTSKGAGVCYIKLVIGYV